MQARPNISELSPLVRSFVSHFGEMGSRWGINRTVGQIYALIFVSPRPLNADDIGESLDFSRSNVSMGLKELQAWQLVQLRHLPGDRREYFEAPTDAWEMFRTLAEEGINIHMISTSEIKTSVVISDKYMELAVRALHKAFGLETAPVTKV